jgi:hypothetical protein
MFAQVEKESDASSLTVSVDPAFEFFADQVLQIAEVLYREHKGRPSLQFCLRRREHVERAAIAFGNRNHAIFRTECSSLSAANLEQSSPA